MAGRKMKQDTGLNGGMGKPLKGHRRKPLDEFEDKYIPTVTITYVIALRAINISILSRSFLPPSLLLFMCVCVCLK